MVVFSAYQPPDTGSDRVAAAERIEFVRDGFSPIAAGFAPFWMVANRVWIPLAAYLAMVVAIQGGAMLLEIRGPLPAILLAAIHVLIGYEAASLRRAALERGGWTFIGTVTGRTEAECERRFFDNWLAGAPAVPAVKV